MAVPPIPRLVLVLQRQEGPPIVQESIAAWELPTEFAVDIRAGEPSVDQARDWMKVWDPQDGPNVELPDSETLFWGADNVGTSAATTRYLPSGWTADIAPARIVEYPMPRAGTIKNLRVRHNSPAGDGDDIIYTVLKDQAATSIVVALASTATAGEDLVNEQFFDVGERIAIQIEQPSSVGTSPTEITASLLLEP